MTNADHLLMEFHAILKNHGAITAGDYLDGLLRRIEVELARPASTPSAKVPSASMLAWASPDSFASYCISKGKKDQKSEWQIAWEIYRDAVGRSL